jgi:hypothetical protein
MQQHIPYDIQVFVYECQIYINHTYSNDDILAGWYSFPTYNHCMRYHMPFLLASIDYIIYPCCSFLVFCYVYLCCIFCYVYFCYVFFAMCIFAICIFAMCFLLCVFSLECLVLYAIRVWFFLLLIVTLGYICQRWFSNIYSLLPSNARTLLRMCDGIVISLDFW